MNCSTINITLTSIDPDHNNPLWGLAESYSQIYCGWQNMTMRLFKLQDFQPYLTNPFYQGEIVKQSLDSIFFPVCYAYSILRIFMVVSVIVYVYQKMEEIMSKSKINVENLRSKPKVTEIKFYKYVIYTSMILELICALRDFFFFRGTLLYANVMNENTQQCLVDFYNNSFTCDTTHIDTTSYRPFNYTRSQCNCLYHLPNDYLVSEYGGYMTFSIIFWIITEGLTLGAIAFSILTLSRINRTEKSGWKFLKPTLQKISLITLFVIIFYTLLIYYFNMQIYFRFYDQGVITFYFFWKILGFLLVFDRLYTKIWLELKLNFQSLHSHGIQWRGQLTKTKAQLKGQSKEYEAIVDDYYKNNIETIIEKYESDMEQKLQTKWYDYLNYMLLINLIGIIGFLFLVFYTLFENAESLFWIGFTLALVELIVFEVSNIVFQLHCFFIELYKQIEQEILEDSQIQEEID